MRKIRVSAVSYLNTKPFLFGIEKSNIKDEIELVLDFPSACAKKLIQGKTDMGLVPVASIPFIEHSYVISDYCIGAYQKVKTVNLYSEIPITQVEEILLDYQSKTSASLVKLLSKKFWKINPVWKDAREGYIESIKGSTAGLVIGDRTFSLGGRFKYVYDLAEEWFKFTQLPFVFAAWVSNMELPEDFTNKFNQALKFGVDNRHLAVRQWQKSIPYIDLNYYFDKCISYHFDEEKRKAMQLFFQLLNEVEIIPNKV